jgi:hypothetical protein
MTLRARIDTLHVFKGCAGKRGLGRDRLDGASNP